MTPAIFLGNFTSESIRLLGLIPDDAPAGEQVRAFHLLVAEDYHPDVNNYWLLQIGKITGTTFKVLAGEISTASGLTTNVLKSYPLAPPVLYSRGDKMAVRFSPRGLAPPLSAVSGCVEYGVLSSRRSDHV